MTGGRRQQTKGPKFNESYAYMNSEKPDLYGGVYSMSENAMAERTSRKADKNSGDNSK